MIDLKIDTLCLSDLDDVMEIESSAYGKHHWSRDSFVSELNNKVAKYYGLRNQEGKLVAYAGVWFIIDEAHITTIAVHSDFRRKHIGEALIAKILEDCYNKFIKYITLEVRVSNTAAVGLYSKFNMKSLGTRKGYYQDNGEDALIMWSENIFSDKFKLVYNDNKEELEKHITIK